MMALTKSSHLSPSDRLKVWECKPIVLADGEPLWTPNVRQFIFVTDDWIERMVVTSDIDNDGWRDIATVTIAGEIRAARLGDQHGGAAEAFVYVDWLSGAHGRAPEMVPGIHDSDRFERIRSL